MIIGRGDIIKNKIKSILFTGGGTLGHILPIIPIGEMLKDINPDIKIYFIGTIKGLEKKYVEETALFSKTFYLDSQGFKRKFAFYNVVTLYKYLICFFKSRKILKTLNPDIVVGMGGYVAGAVVRAALGLKIKTAVHEQNSVFGFTNKILKKKVHKVLLSYPIEENEKTILVGNPRVSEIYNRYKDRIGEIKHCSVLAVGGSRGADRINDLIISLKPRFQKHHISVILITGQKYYKENIKTLSAQICEEFVIKPFVGDLPSLLIDAGVVITRAGATTISEIMALRKICIFIPSPNVTNNHQEKNAAAIADKGGAIMLKEEGLHEDVLFETIMKALTDKALRNSIINNINFIADVDACKHFVEELNGMVNDE